MSIRWSLVIFTAAAGVAPAFAQDGASWLRTRTLSNALNPNISVIGDIVGQAGPRGDADANRVAVRETEIGLQAAVDPYARADFFLAIHDGESPELEEGFVTLLALPGALQARGGKFRANFGRLNMVHPHERPQVTSPLVLDSYLGDEGLNDTGVEVSRIFGPFGIFSELSYGVLNGLGGEHRHGEENGETVFITATDENGNPILDSETGLPKRFPVVLHEEEPHVPRTIRNFAHVARVRFYRDLTGAANAELGFSGALHQPEGHEQRKLGGMDLTFRWKPLRGGLYRSFIWRTEGIYSSRVLEEEADVTGAVTAPERKLDRRGAYSYVEYQFARRWRFGVRADYMEDPEADDEVFTLEDGSTRQVERSVTRAVSPVLTFTATEFQRMRVEYAHARLPSGAKEHRGYLQWTVILGPHGGHPF
jgi:hypothetical protein